MSVHIYIYIYSRRDNQQNWKIFKNNIEESQPYSNCLPIIVYNVSVYITIIAYVVSALALGKRVSGGFT